MRETELIERCREGDEHAFRHLVEIHHDRVYRVAYAVTGSSMEAEDVAQETFLKAWRSLKQFRGGSSLSTWLTRIALNAGRDSLRRQRSRETVRQVLRALQMQQGHV